MALQIHRWQCTVKDFARMVEAGIFTEDDRVELIDGEIRVMSPIDPRHAAIVKRLNALLTRQLADRAIVSVQDPIQLTDYSEPQPDLAVLWARGDFYAQAHPMPTDLLLVVEVAETSLEYDRDEKLPRYAQVLIPEVWLIDVAREAVTQYTQPDGTRYRSEQLLERGQVIASHTVSNLQLFVDRILGKALCFNREHAKVSVALRRSLAWHRTGADSLRRQRVPCSRYRAWLMPGRQTHSASIHAAPAGSRKGQSLDSPFLSISRFDV